MSISRLGMVAALMLLSTSSAAAQAARVGYVNTTQVLEEYTPAQEARQALESARLDADSELQLLGRGLQAAFDEYQQQAMTMTPEARQAREAELQNQQRALQSREQELNLQFQERQAELLQPVMERVTAVIEEIRVEGSYALILDSASQAILAGDPALDLTQEVLTRLQTDPSPGG